MLGTVVELSGAELEGGVDVSVVDVLGAELEG